jgi:hypothetical protein
MGGFRPRPGSGSFGSWYVISTVLLFGCVKATRSEQDRSIGTERKAPEFAFKGFCCLDLEERYG